MQAFNMWLLHISGPLLIVAQYGNRNLFCSISHNLYSIDLPELQPIVKFVNSCTCRSVDHNHVYIVTIYKYKANVCKFNRYFCLHACCLYLNSLRTMQIPLMITGRQILGVIIFLERYNWYSLLIRPNFKS